MMRIKLEDYKLIDNNRQVDKSGLIYEKYGSTNNGLIFERDGNSILYHVSNGLKLVDSYVHEGCFFRDDEKDPNNFFLHYKNIKDYKYSKKPLELSIDSIIKTVKEYVYLHAPNLHTRTMMGYKDKGVLSDPNYCNSLVILDDFKKYGIFKRYGTVKIFKDYEKNKFDCDKDNDDIACFELEEDIYKKSLELQRTKREILSTFCGSFDAELFIKYVNIENYIKEKLNCV